MASEQDFSSLLKEPFESMGTIAPYKIIEDSPSKQVEEPKEEPSVNVEVSNEILSPSDEANDSTKSANGPRVKRKYTRRIKPELIKPDIIPITETNEEPATDNAPITSNNPDELVVKDTAEVIQEVPKADIVNETEHSSSIVEEEIVEPKKKKQRFTDIKPVEGRGKTKVVDPAKIKRITAKDRKEVIDAEALSSLCPKQYQHLMNHKKYTESLSIIGNTIPKKRQNNK